MKKYNWIITKWSKNITDSGKDEYKKYTDIGNKEELIHKFRLLDDDGTVYAYGLSADEESFGPLDYYGPEYGCTEIQYKNPETKQYETL